MVSTSLMIFWCCFRYSSSVSPSFWLVCITMSSMYTISSPLAIWVWNRVFIMDWKVVGELVNPKNITVGSNNPSLVVKATFHLHPFFTHTVLYPHLMLNLVKRVHPLKRSICCGIRGKGYLFRTVHTFTGL